MTHSFLIVGGTVNKRKLEARRLILEKKLETGSSKNQASSVQPPLKPPASSLQLQSAVDVTVLEPEEDKQTITIDQVRDLQHQLSLKPYAAKFKTGIILEAQRMTIEAQNALLKTLEEPPAHSILILTAPSTKALLPTTVSRCQIVRLQAEIDLDVASEEHQQQAQEFLQLLGSDRGERLAWIEDNKTTMNNEQSAIVHLDIWISVLRDLLLMNSNLKSLMLNKELQDRFSFILSSMKESNNFEKILTRALERTIETKNLLASTNVSARLALEVLLLDLPILPNPNPKG